MIQKKLVSLACACALATVSVAAHSDTMLGAYVKYDGWSVAEIDKFNTDTAKPMALVTLFTTFDNNWDSLSIQASNIVSSGGTPVITWMPYSENTGDVLASIAAGDQDAYINDWIANYKLWRESYSIDERPNILLRFGHEFNGNWYPWGNNPEGLKTAWRHVHSLFETADVNDSVDWVWCMNNVDVDTVNDITQYYPGDDVVDWTSIDGYNWGSNYSFTSWANFDQVFSSAYVKLVSNYPNKPILIAEVGSAEPNDLPDPAWGQDGNDTDANESKETWVQDMYSRIITDYPAIRGVSWFNINKELSWALNDIAHSGLPNTGLTAYNATITDDHYTSTFTSVQDIPEKNKSNNKGGRGKGKNAPKTTGLQRAMSVSQMPAVVGDKLLARQAEGFRNLPEKALKKIKDSRLNR